MRLPSRCEGDPHGARAKAAVRLVSELGTIGDIADEEAALRQAPHLRTLLQACTNVFSGGEGGR